MSTSAIHPPRSDFVNLTGAVVSAPAVERSPEQSRSHPLSAQGATDVAIIGAGPYGLSLAAHLAAAGVRFRIFGQVMETWRINMPPGLFLKSGGQAANIHAPGNADTLTRFCAEEEARRIDRGTVLSASLFIRYGRWFQQRYVPDVEEIYVRSCVRAGEDFLLTLENGDLVRARSVVVATGYSNCAHVPEELACLPSDLISHSSEYGALDSWRGREVAVLGSGQSALELAALLNEAGAAPKIIARSPSVTWGGRAETRRSLYARLRHPMTTLGAGWDNVFFTHPATPFGHLPSSVRRRTLEGALGPLGAWWLRDRVVGKVPMMLGWNLSGVEANGDRVRLALRRGGEQIRIEADHVIAATGYHIAPRSFAFLSPELARAIRWEFGSPVLSWTFESTEPGLHFIGLSSAYRFGPAMRFVTGAALTTPRLARALAHRYAS